MSNWTPNYDQITGFVRAVVPAIIAWMTAHGWGWSGTTWGQVLVVVVVTLASCVWSYFNNPTGKTIQ